MRYLRWLGVCVTAVMLAILPRLAGAQQAVNGTVSWHPSSLPLPHGRSLY